MKRTFGVDVKLDEKGRPIEQGIGAKGNESINHYVALAKYEPSPEHSKLRDAALKEHAERVANSEADEDDDGLKGL